MNIKIKLSLIFFTIFNLSVCLQASQLCSEVFRIDQVSYIDGLRVEKNKKYTVHVNNTTPILQLEFKRELNEENGIRYFEFIQNDKKIVRFKEEDIYDFTTELYKESKAKNLLEYSGNTLLTAHIFSKLIFNPYKTLAKSSNIHVVGSLKESNKKLAGKMIENLNIFDTFMETIGFSLPKTRIILSTKPILPPIMGPFAISNPISNIWHGKAETTIAMNPILIFKKVVENKFILFHERTHTVLKTHYNSKAYVNRYSFIQEAFADFSAAHISNSPGYILSFRGRNSGGRNINYRADGHHQINSVLDVKPNNPHRNSLFISSILWELREQLGLLEFSRIFKPLIDNLNMYREAFEVNHGLENKKIRLTPENLILELEYFMAVLIKTNEEELGQSQKAEWVSRGFISMLRLDPKNIAHTLKLLEKGDDIFTSKNTDNISRKEMIKIYTIGATGLLVKMYLLYELLDDD